MSQDSGFENRSLPAPPPPPQGKFNLKVLALAVVCIVLAAGIVGILVVYQPTSLQSQVNSKNNEIKTLQTQIENLTAQLAAAPNAADYENEISSLNSSIASLTQQLNGDESQLSTDSTILQLGSSEVLVNKTLTIENYTDVFDSALQYAGYVVVQATSNASATYAQAIYSVSGVNYDINATIGLSGTAAFPVLPTTVDIRVGDAYVVAIDANVTVTYYY